MEPMKMTTETIQQVTAALRLENARLLDALDRIASGEFANNVTPSEKLSAMLEVARNAIEKAHGNGPKNTSEPYSD
jgi:hypothetical protein